MHFEISIPDQMNLSFLEPSLHHKHSLSWDGRARGLGGGGALALPNFKQKIKNN